MSNEVYANCNAIACKSGMGKVIAAFPDVCLSPPSPPAGPIPIPYPNTSFSKDMMNGSKTVKINGKEVMLKDQSFYKTAPLGDEAATQGLGASVITHVITGKTYFGMWSMDVKFEGENVDRHIDLTTSNHNPYPGSTLPMMNGELMAVAIDRIENNECPCCGNSNCPAAFKPGDEPLSFEDYYKLNEKDGKGKLSKRALRRQEEFAEMVELKKKCSCKRPSNVFPQAPCDVFRAPAPKNKSPDKMTAAEKRAYDRTKAINSKWFNFGGWRAKYVAWYEKKHKVKLTAPGEEGKINHLVPRSAGGCPTKQGNLQPNEELCSNCKEIDKMQTKWQGG